MLPFDSLFMECLMSVHNIIIILLCSSVKKCLVDFIIVCVLVKSKFLEYSYHWQRQQMNITEQQLVVAWYHLCNIIVSKYKNIIFNCVQLYFRYTQQSFRPILQSELQEIVLPQYTYLRLSMDCSLFCETEKLSLFSLQAMMTDHPLS